ncbi:O-linked N-acetylglucosamine transferase family protein [Rhodovibrionaceae bacterium A322]
MAASKTQKKSNDVPKFEAGWDVVPPKNSGEPFLRRKDDSLLELIYRADISVEDIAKAHFDWAEQNLSHLYPDDPDFDLDWSPDRKLRVGYLSPDFRNHVVAYGVLPIIMEHSSQQVETIGYFNHHKADDLTAVFRNSFNGWRDVRALDDAALYDLIRKDKIDILVDLAGHTAGGRLGVFARRAAPVQVSYYGYPSTTGLKTMDYRITDPWCDPVGMTEHLHSEKLTRFEKGYSTVKPARGLPDHGPLPAKKNGYITFGSFNNAAKLTPLGIDIWAQAMRRIPDSRILFKARHLEREELREGIYQRFEMNEVSRDRVEFVDYTATMGEHYAVYQRVDIALDSFPYNGTTTTFDALCMGVPVLTIAGDHHAARVSTSLVSRVGLNFCSVTSAADFIALAQALAADINSLESIRSSLRLQIVNSPIIDSVSYTRNLESTYRDYWKTYLAEQGKLETSEGAASSAAEEEGGQVVDLSPCLEPCLNDVPDGGLSKKEIEEGVASFPFWYHLIDLPKGVRTPGHLPHDASAYRLPKDLTGMRVLDVGAWDGRWTFEALRRGAREVVAIDDFSDFLGLLENSQRKAWENFDFCKKAFGYSDERCKRVDISVYDITEEQFGRFDLVMFFGVLYHLRYPLLALDKVSALCDRTIIVETAIADDYSPYRGGLGKGYDAGDMVMEFYPNKEYGSNDSNWFAPTLSCTEQLVKAAGFDTTQAWKLTENPTHLTLCRGFVWGKKTG